MLLSPIISTLFSALMYVSIKKMDNFSSHYDLLFFRSIFILILFSPQFANLKFLFQKESSTVWLRCIFGVVALNLFFYCIKNGSPLQVAVLTTLSPVSILIINYSLFKQKILIKNMIGVVVIVLSVFLLKLKGNVDFDNTYSLLTIAGVLLSSFGFIFLKKSSKIYNNQFLVFAFALVTLLSSLWGVEFNNLINSYNNPWLYVVGLSALGAQYFLTISYKKLDPSVANALLKLNVIWLYFLDIIFLSNSFQLYDMFCFIFLLLGSLLSLKKIKVVK